jgi:DNA-binding CsgD family transcriptional regulator
LTALAAHDFADLRYGGHWNYSITFLAQLCANLADGPRAALLYDILESRAEHNVVSGVTFATYGAAAYHLARLAVTMNRADLATRHFEAAIRLHDRLRARPWLARTRLQYAMAVLDGRAVGTPERALDEARLALDAATSIGMPILQEQAAALLGPAVQPPPSEVVAGEPTYPDGLTAREVEVLALVASGASNVETARILFLSPGTVRWHTIRIYQKIGARGRAEAAAYAVRHGLVRSTQPPAEGTA